MSIISKIKNERRYIDITDIEKIVNGNYKVTEKQKLLIEYKEKIDCALREVTNGYKYCPRCGEYYKINTWETENRKEERTVCTYRDAGYGDDDKYERLLCPVQYSICPIGHRIEGITT